MIELVIAMAIMTIALSALVAVFSSGMLAVRRASQTTAAAALAHTQLETFRAMTSRDIGIDVSAGTVAALDSNYKNDAACANSTISKTCATDGVAATEIGPTGTSPHTCSAINAWYANTLPCTPSRTASASTTPASPDGRSYRVDTYVIQVAATSSQRASKQVTVIVRDSSALGGWLARETSTFDCSTGVTPGLTDC